MKTINLFCIVVCFFCATLSVGFVLFDAYFFPLAYKEEIVKYANEYNLETSLVFGLVKTESGFKEKVVSRSGALGLMQIMPKTGEWVAEKLNIKNYSESMLYDAQTNIKIGCYYLSYLIGKYTHLNTALACYNAGEGIMASFIDEDKNVVKYPFEETAKYVQKVKNYAKIYKSKI